MRRSVCANRQGCCLSLDPDSWLSQSRFLPADVIAQTWGRSQPVEPKRLDVMDIPELLADRFGIHNFELQQIYFLSMEPSYFTRFNERLKKAKSKISNMPLELDDQGYAGIVGPSSPGPALRAKALDLTKQWMDRAAMIGCPSVMLNQGSGPLTENHGPTIETLKSMTAYGKTKNVAVTIQNRGRAMPEQVANLIKAAGIYANPDLGNFPDEETRARGMRLPGFQGDLLDRGRWPRSLCRPTEDH